MVKPSTRRCRRLGEVDLEVGDALGQELVGWDAVELGEAQEPRHRDRAFAALVGAEDRGLELLVGARLDVVERKSLLSANRPEALTDVPSVDPFHAVPMSPAPPARTFSRRTVSESDARHHSLRFLGGQDTRFAGRQRRGRRDCRGLRTKDERAESETGHIAERVAARRRRIHPSGPTTTSHSPPSAAARGGRGAARRVPPRTKPG